MRNIKNQKGAISLFVILAMLFFLAFMLGVFSITTRRNSAQLEAVRETAKIYSSGIDANSIYDTMVATQSSVVKPISTFEQLKKQKEIMESTSGITANYTINGELYRYDKDSSYMLANDIIIDLNNSANGIHNQANTAIYDYMLYDKTKYKIYLNNHNIYYRLSDGSLWKCVFYQDIGTSAESANKFSSNVEAGKSYNATKYSILDNGLEEFRHPWTNSSGSEVYFEFLLMFSEYKDSAHKFDTTHYNRWQQKENPTTVQETVTNYYGITTTLGTTQSWGGLSKSNSGKTYLDGSVGHGNWYYAVGAQSWYDSYGIPNASTSSRKCLLFVRAK